MSGQRYSEADKRRYAQAIIAGETQIFKVMEETGAMRNSVAQWVAKEKAGRWASVPVPPIIVAAPSPAPPEAPEARIIDRPTSPQRIFSGERVLVIPDLHCPFEHPDALAFLVEVQSRFKTTAVVNLGDEADFHAFSRWPMDPDGFSAGRELAAAIDHLMPFYRAFPEALVCESNHTVRPWKKVFEAGLPAAFSPTYATILKAPDGWQWAHKHVIDGVRYIHGEGRSGKYAHSQFMMTMKCNVVIGHIHSYAGVTTEGDHFAMNAGCLIDHNAYAFKYAKNMPIAVSLGCGLVIEGREAHFIPMRLDEYGRWTGKLGL